MVIMWAKYLQPIIISTVWFQLIKQTGKYRIAGEQGIDSNWRSEVRHLFKSIEFNSVFVQGDRILKICDSLSFPSFWLHEIQCFGFFIDVSEFVICLQHGFEGIAWESWSQLIGRADNKFFVNLAPHPHLAHQQLEPPDNCQPTFSVFPPHSDNRQQQHQQQQNSNRTSITHRHTFICTHIVSKCILRNIFPVHPSIPAFG
uniref:Uncharacterized protein n=1 Tax=Glossina palpalis gambiensis TaxID=67801 RepID=A0A1B0BIP0_9MUSC